MEIVDTATQDVEPSLTEPPTEKEIAAVRCLLKAVGEDPWRDGLLDTPRRVVKALREFTEGYTQDPREILSRTFDVKHDEMIVLKGVRFQALCEHHLLPFTGIAHVGYIPKERIVGLSKLARLVQCFARRLQVQERMTTQIVDAIMQHLDPQGAGVVIEAFHSCMAYRGAQQPSAKTHTSALRGAFLQKEATRAEFFRLAQGS